MFFLKYLSLLEIKEISIICSKPYGFELLILLYNQTHNNYDTGVEETFQKLKFNRSQRPAYISFLNDLEQRGIILRQPSQLKKSKILLRLNKILMNEIDQLLKIDDY
ncbi:hypothetical protein OAC99_01540 [Amylibacter sp.]|nr:hypothetical protein [Amylibacter sp.]